MATTPTTPTPAPNLGNQVDAVAKKKFALDLPVWVYVAAIVVANAIGVFLHF